MTYAPFMRWIGGKWRLSEQICLNVPSKYELYHEPMLGSGAVMLRLLQQRRLKRPMLSDANAHLIRAWKGLLTFAPAVKRQLFYHAAHHSYAYFLQQRELGEQMLGEDLPSAAAWFLYLNRASYNGLWRVSADGKINLSWGNKSQASIQNFSKINAVVSACQERGLDASCFQCLDVEQSMTACDRGDCVYVDPPYVETFTAYTADGWPTEQHVRLAQACLAAAGRGATVLLSQSAEAAGLYDRIFEPCAYQKVRIQARRSVSQDPAKRGLVNEILYVLGGKNA